MASDSKPAIIKMRVAHHVGLINNVIYIIDHVGVTNLYGGGPYNVLSLEYDILPFAPHHHICHLYSDYSEALCV